MALFNSAGDHLSISNKLQNTGLTGRINNLIRIISCTLRHSKSCVCVNVYVFLCACELSCESIFHGHRLAETFDSTAEVKRSFLIFSPGFGSCQSPKNSQLKPTHSLHESTFTGFKGIFIQRYKGKSLRPGLPPRSLCPRRPNQAQPSHDLFLTAFIMH